jgi:glutaconyl-CoA decarboxylase
MRKFRLNINGRWYDVEVGDLGKLPIPVFVNGEWFEVWLESAIPTVEAPVKVEVEERRLPELKPKAEVVAAEGTVSAPMPGKIVSINVGIGDRVKYRDVLCILEAMKMENEIMAPAGGVVREVRVSEGQDVQYGDVLFVICSGEHLAQNPPG